MRFNLFFSSARMAFFARIKKMLFLDSFANSRISAEPATESGLRSLFVESIETLDFGHCKVQKFIVLVL